MKGMWDTESFVRKRGKCLFHEENRQVHESSREDNLVVCFQFEDFGILCFQEEDFGICLFSV